MTKAVVAQATVNGQDGWEVTLHHPWGAKSYERITRHTPLQCLLDHLHRLYPDLQVSQ